MGKPRFRVRYLVGRLDKTIIDSLERWFDPNIPMEYIIISFSVLCIVMAIGFMAYRGQWMKRFVMGALAIEYYFLVLCSTVICHTAPVSKRVELMPFYNYVDIWNGVDFKRTVMEILLNVALFVPIGFLLGGMMPKEFLKVLLIGFFFQLDRIAPACIRKGVMRD